MSDPLPPRKDLAERIGSLFAFDCIRLSRILETAQYAAIFGVLAFIVGFAIDWAFRPAYPKPTAKKAGCPGKLYTKVEALQALGIVILQVMVSAVLVIYIRKLGEVVPFIFEFCPDKYVPHWKVKEVEGELAVALIYVGIQTGILDTLSKLRKSFAYSDCAEDEEDS